MTDQQSILDNTKNGKESIGLYREKKFHYYNFWVHFNLEKISHNNNQQNYNKAEQLTYIEFQSQITKINGFGLSDVKNKKKI